MGRLNVIVVLLLMLMLGACARSMTAVQVARSLPKLTHAFYLSQSEANENVSNNCCKYLVKGRIYKVPMDMAVHFDLISGAKEIDACVARDGGNAYVVTNYKWLVADDKGSTQLYIEFDTLLCQ
ncbi:MAG: hypothetical protein RIS29_1898 [Bacteroidota bacterium]|jgi:hypothetical protein